jgi:hypothetical protein
MGAQVNSRAPAAGRNADRKRGAVNEYDPLLPSQYYDRVAGGRAPSGEFKLFFAILEDALRSYVRAKDCRSAAKRAEFLDAQVWFHTRGAPHLFSFESICSFLGIDPSWLRERLESLTPTDFPLKQYRTRRHRPARPSARREDCRGGKGTIPPEENQTAPPSKENSESPLSQEDSMVVVQSDNHQEESATEVPSSDI